MTTVASRLVIPLAATAATRAIPARGGAKDESFVPSRRLRLSGPEAQPPGIHVSVLEARLARRQAPPGLGMDDGVPGREHSAAWRRPG